MHIILTIISFLIFITVVVGVHEWGHYLAAKYFSVGVREIGFGFGKPLFKKKNHCGEIISISPFLIGGFVRLVDSRNEALDKDEIHLDYSRKSICARFVILISGILMNMAFAIFCFTLVFWAGLYPLEPRVEKVSSTSVFTKGSLLAGDKFVKVDDKPILGWANFALIMASNLGEKNLIPIVVEGTNGKKRKFDLNLSHVYFSGVDTNIFQLLGFSPNETKETFLKYSFFGALKQGVMSSYYLASLNLLVIKKIITGYISPLALAGPLVLIEQVHFFFLEGVFNFLQFLALASIAVAIANLIPIPGLDGGQILLLGLEKIRKKPLSRAWELLLQRLGYVFLFVLCMQLLANDFYRIARNHQLPALAQVK